MKNQQKIIRRIVAIAILLFGIWNVLWQFLDYAFSDSAGLNATERMWEYFAYVNFAILLVMSILPFFSRHRTIFIIDLAFALIGIIFWIIRWGWWDASTNLTNIIFLVVVLAFDCWQFIANKKNKKALN